METITIKQNNQVFNQKPQEKKIRNGWIEVLRFLAISIIMFTHFSNSNPAFHDWFPRFDNGGEIGVCIFLLISGFCAVRQTKNRTFKFLITFLVWVFWGLIIYLIAYYCGVQADNPLSIFFGRFIAGKYSSWWFIWVYLAFTLLQPFINKFIQKNTKWLTFGFIILFYFIYHTLIFIPGFDTFKFGYLTLERLMYFSWIYAIAGWISFHFKEKINAKRPIKFVWLLLFFVVTYILLWFRIEILSVISPPFEDLAVKIVHNLLITLFGISLLLLFDNIPVIKKHISINKVFLFLGKITLGMYLMHPMVWTLLDYAYLNPEIYSTGFYVVKFIAYYSTAVAAAIFMYFFTNVQEKWINSLILKAKQKKKN